MNTEKKYTTEYYVNTNPLNDKHNIKSNDFRTKVSIMNRYKDIMNRNYPQNNEELKEKFVEIQLSKENGEPASGESFNIILPNGAIITGSLNDEGYAKIEVECTDVCEIEFPDLDNDQWDA